jgi:hypothetical protein
VHPEWGTANAILPVGNTQYVEAIGVVDPASEHPLSQVLRSLVSGGDRPVGVCLRPDDLDATARRLDLDVTEGTRANPGGVALRWRMAGLQSAFGPDRLPFFIEWPGGGGSPELEGVSQVAGDGLAWVELGGDAQKLKQWVGADLPAVRAVSGTVGVHRFGIRRGDESVVVDAR